MRANDNKAYLIVNADDYGYYDCVSRGILDGVENGIVTATGIFGNSEKFEEHIKWLKQYEAVDAGVHLNLTDGAPLTSKMRSKLTFSNGCFPGKYLLLIRLLLGSVKPEDVATEWRAQIERCLDTGLKLYFLNSHEHIHMLPSLFGVTQELAKEFDIPNVRFPISRPLHSFSTNAIVRDTMLRALSILNRNSIEGTPTCLLGLEQSGKLNIEFLKRTFSCLESGVVYELMCHPGYCKSTNQVNAKLTKYHDWNGEHRTLTNPAMQQILEQNNIQLIGFRNLEIRNGEMIVICPKEK
jgi:predicted glycoside hydrolase/deacetylase ChbG (UPF0249 family)